MKRNKYAVYAILHQLVRSVRVSVCKLSRENQVYLPTSPAADYVMVYHLFKAQFLPTTPREMDFREWLSYIRSVLANRAWD